MDHSQHSIHNHDHHHSSMHHPHHPHQQHTDAHAGHDHAAMLTTTGAPLSPLDILSSSGAGAGSGASGVHDHHATHYGAGADGGMTSGGGGGGGGAADGHMGMMQHAMSMAFHFSSSETVLFSWWKFDSVLGLLGSMLVIFLMAIIYEGLKYYREYLFWKTYNLLEYRPVTGPQTRGGGGGGNGNNPEDPQHATPTTSASPVQYVGEVIHKQPPSMLSLNHLYQTLLHVLQVTLSFLLMLIFMTYNVWLCIAVVLGAAVGYFLFCWKKSVIVDVTEHCH